MSKASIYWRILLRGIILPILILFILVFIANKIEEGVTEELEEVSFNVGWVDKQMGKELYDLIDLNVYFNIQSYKTVDEVESALEAGTVDLYIEIEDEFDTLLIRNTANCSIISNEANALQYLEATLIMYQQRVLNTRIDSLGLTHDAITPFDYNYIDNSFSIVDALDSVNKRLHQGIALLWMGWCIWISSYLFLLWAEYKERKLKLRDYSILALIGSSSTILFSLVTYGVLMYIGNDTIERLGLAIAPFFTFTNILLSWIFVTSISFCFYGLGLFLLKIQSWRVFISSVLWLSFLLFLGAVYCVMNGFVYVPMLNWGNWLIMILAESTNSTQQAIIGIILNFGLGGILVWWQTRRH